MFKRKYPQRAVMAQQLRALAVFAEYQGWFPAPTDGARLSRTCSQRIQSPLLASEGTRSTCGLYTCMQAKHKQIRKLKIKRKYPQETTVFVSDNEIIRDSFGLCLLDLSSVFIFLSFFFLE